MELAMQQFKDHYDMISREVMNELNRQ